MAHPDRPLSLYIHVPFCTDKCLYCDFFSVPRRAVGQSTLEAMVDETLRLAHRLVASAGAGKRVGTIFIGGGTPSCLPLPLLTRLLGSFTGMGAEEWTVESNPETLDEAFLDACARAGVTRLSVGIQTLNTGHLKTLRRHATARHSRSAIELLRKRWRGELNLDFMTGIPGQTAADVREALSVLEAGWPDHVSLYQLTVEPGTPLEALVGAGSISLNASEIDEDLWIEGRDLLVSLGFGQYEVSNFARPGHECRHNMSYWRIDPYAGAGPGAVSTLPAEWAARAADRPDLAEGGQSVIRFTAPRDIPAFLQGESRFWGIETEVIRPVDFLKECIMMGLRLARGIPESALVSRFGRKFSEFYPGLWEGWVTRGLAEPPDGTLRLTSEGLLLLDLLLREVFETPLTSSEEVRVQWPP